MYPPPGSKCIVNSLGSEPLRVSDTNVSSDRSDRALNEGGSWPPAPTPHAQKLVRLVRLPHAEGTVLRGAKGGSKRMRWHV